MLIRIITYKHLKFMLQRGRHTGAPGDPGQHALLTAEKVSKQEKGLVLFKEHV